MVGLSLVLTGFGIGGRVKSNVLGAGGEAHQVHSQGWGELQRNFLKVGEIIKNLLKGGENCKVHGSVSVWQKQITMVESHQLSYFHLCGSSAASGHLDVNLQVTGGTMA